MKPDKAKSYGYIVGSTLAIIVFTCVAVVIGSACIAGAINILKWLF